MKRNISVLRQEEKYMLAEHVPCDLKQDTDTAESQTHAAILRTSETDYPSNIVKRNDVLEAACFLFPVCLAILRDLHGFCIVTVLSKFFNGETYYEKKNKSNIQNNIRNFNVLIPNPFYIHKGKVKLSLCLTN
jgi:hypothetical protein